MSPKHQMFQLPQAEEAAVAGAMAGLTSAQLQEEQPTEHHRMSLPGARAQASVWVNSLPPVDHCRTIVIGHYYAETVKAGTALLETIIARHASGDAAMAIGPMNGNTWRRYRLVTSGGSEPPFYLEPFSPPEDLEAWKGAGFAPIHHYQSVLVPQLAPLGERLKRAEQRFRERGLSFRQTTSATFEDDLRAIHRLSLNAFRRNAFYTELPWDAFRTQYRKVESLLRHDCVELAFDGARLVGFCFGIPNGQESPVAPRTLITKTLAIDPHPTYRGLGVLLVGRLEARARDLGFQRAIHALEAVDNASTHISAKVGKVMREYALMARDL